MMDGYWVVRGEGSRGALFAGRRRGRDKLEIVERRSAGEVMGVNLSVEGKGGMQLTVFTEEARPGHCLVLGRGRSNAER